MPKSLDLKGKEVKKLENKRRQKKREQKSVKTRTHLYVEPKYQSVRKELGSKGKEELERTKKRKTGICGTGRTED